MNTNNVTLIGHYGNDEIHAQAAWVSTGGLTPEKQERMPALLKMLAEKGHHTPFERSILHFSMTVEQASHIHFLKHRVGVSINGESARYRELKEDRFYVPKDWPVYLRNRITEHCVESFNKYHDTLDDLVYSGMARKRAKESARFFLPYASQIMLDVSFNFRSFHHFLGLRKKPEAQKEIHDLAAAMLEQVRDIKGNPFKYTLEAFGY